MKREQEKALFARMKRVGFSNLNDVEKIEITKLTGGSYPSNSYEQILKMKSGNDGTTFFHGGKAYKVLIDESRQTVAVDERYQDKNHKWHTGKNIIFAQGEDAQRLIDDAGGAYVNKIVDYLDSAGALGK